MREIEVRENAADAYDFIDNQDEAVERLAQAMALELPSWVPPVCIYAGALGKLAALNRTPIDANPFRDSGRYYLEGSWYLGSVVPSRHAKHRDPAAHGEHRFHDHRETAQRLDIQTMAQTSQKKHNIRHGWLYLSVKESVRQPYPNTAYNHPLFVSDLIWRRY